MFGKVRLIEIKAVFLHSQTPEQNDAKLPKANRAIVLFHKNARIANRSYRQFNKTLKKAYEGLGNTMSVYNAFVQANINVVKVFITKQVKANGGSVLAPYQITRGTLPSIAYEKNADAVLVTNLQLGGLVIGAETEVGELAEAIIGHNAEWESGDQLTFFYGRQTVDSVTGTPRAVIVGTKVVLDVTDGTPVWDITGSLGFASVAVSRGTGDRYLSQA